MLKKQYKPDLCAQIHFTYAFVYFLENLLYHIHCSTQVHLAEIGSVLISVYLSIICVVDNNNR